MRVYGDVMRELAEAEVATWPAGEAFPLLPAMQRLTLRIILRTVFGVEGARMAELERALGRAACARGTRIMLRAAAPARLRAPAARSGASRPRAPRSTRLLLAEIARRRESGDRGDDVLSMLLDARGEDGSSRPRASCATT